MPLVLPLVLATHYTFSRIGYGVFSSDVANLAIPVDVLQLKPAMINLKKIIKNLQEAATTHESHRVLGPILSSLASTSTERYVMLEDKYRNVIHFFSSKSHSLPGQPIDPNFPSLIIPAPTPSSTMSQEPDGRPREKAHLDTLFSNNSIQIKKKMGGGPDYSIPLNVTTKAPGSRRKRSADPILELEREKRFLGGLFTSLLVSLGVSTVFGLMTSQQLAKLGSAVQTLEGRQELLIHQIEQDSKDIATNRIAIKTLADVAQGIAKLTSEAHWTSVGNSAAIIIANELAKVENVLNTFVNIMEAASNHKMHFSVLTQQGAEQALSKIKELAQSRHLYPVITTTQQLAQLDCSYILTSRGFNLVVHVPLANEMSTFVIHRFQPLPIPIGSKVYGILRPDNDIIAIGDADHKGLPRFIELSSTDLNLCKKIGGSYICRDSRIFTRPSQPTCLYSLFTGNHVKAVSQCHLTLEPKEEDRVVAVSATQFVYYAKKPSSFQYHCYGNSSVLRGHQLTKFTPINIPLGCMVETKAFILTRQNELFTTAEALKFKWTLPGVEFLQNDTSIKDLEGAMEKLKDIKGLPKITADTIAKIKAFHTPFYQKPLPTAAIVLGMLALILILSLLGVIFWQAYRTKRKERLAADPVHRFTEILKRHENIDSILGLLEAEAVRNN